MLGAGTAKSKGQILLPPMGTLSQHQTLVLTDGTYRNKTSQVYTTIYRIFVPNKGLSA